ncbi:MAG TPA: thiamine diphosphokinase [Acidimicrobiia bacterium]|nr:thiamine diphosphokinase [Acidimicrobiia bacterium]
MTTTAWVFTGGDPPDSRSLAEHRPDHLVVAADSGLTHALAAGVAVDVVVGDLDSVDAAELDRAVAAEARVEQHPTDKNQTDLELALHVARRAGAHRIVVLGAGGGRLDHFLANTMVLAAPALGDVDIEAHIERSRVHVVRAGRPRALRGAPGDILTLLPVGGAARGVRATGVRWELRTEDLASGSSRGVSNEMTAETAFVDLDEGVLIAIQPSPGS